MLDFSWDKALIYDGDSPSLLHDQHMIHSIRIGKVLRRFMGDASLRFSSSVPRFVCVDFGDAL